MPYKTRNKLIHIRVTEKDYADLKKGADLHDMKLSEYIRWRLQKVRVLEGAKGEFNFTDG